MLPLQHGQCCASNGGDKPNYLDGFERLEFFDGSGPEHARRRPWYNSCLISITGSALVFFAGDYFIPRLFPANGRIAFLLLALQCVWSEAAPQADFRCRSGLAVGFRAGFAVFAGACALEPPLAFTSAA